MALILLTGLSLVVVGIAAVWLWPNQPLNVLIITLDTTRADRIGCYGYNSAKTPRLDELARIGVLFERAYTLAPLTLPSHASIFTGLWPPEHGILSNGQNGLADDIPTLAGLFRLQNYNTAAFVAAFVP